MVYLGEIIPKWPYFRLMNYYNLPRLVNVYIAIENGHRNSRDLPIEHSGSFQFAM